MREIGLILTVIFLGTSLIEAQPTLSKRDQKKKAEFEALIAAEEKYEELRVVADKAFKDKDYVEARMKYQEAIQYNAEKESWLVSKVNDLDILMARIVARKVDSILVLPKVENVAMEMESKLDTEKRELPEPPSLPEENLEIEEHPDDGMDEEVTQNVVEDPMEELVEIVEDIPASEKPKNKTPERVVVQPPVKKVKDDFADLPQGMTESEFDYPDHHVWRIVVKDGIDMIVYKRVKHRWGGDFCFKDDVSISQRIWNEEVDRYRDKFPSK